MTIGILTLLALSSTLVLFKLGLVALAVLLLTNMFPSKKPFELRTTPTSLSLQRDANSFFVNRELDE